ncbi:RimJ/RimL family protein N-acetyltransferase [Mumia flava]|uniref:RimJ/RimL family protein N-acetyltransferase n=1 Tax=Mumia flava TaxID=1348852 RepID=A0A2M9BFP5_9ACTN|nr:GNAT family N-acetyltransferase [Mumia flava]PJJ56768.1 RimJ/RimL family protein N-acetyltransferase [Mumia flava]
MSEIRTERLLLRSYVPSDAPRVLDLRSRYEVIRWLSDPPYVLMETLDEAEAWIAKESAPNPDPRMRSYAVEVADTGLVVGTVMVAALPRTEPPEYQIGWHLHPDSQGRGYATEAARALLDDTFVRFDGSGPDRPPVDELWCDMFADNDASAAVARRLGFRDTGIRDDPWYDGDGHIFVMTRADWERAGGTQPVG